MPTSQIPSQRVNRVRVGTKCGLPARVAAAGLVLTCETAGWSRCRHAGFAADHPPSLSSRTAARRQSWCLRRRHWRQTRGVLTAHPAAGQHGVCVVMRQARGTVEPGEVEGWVSLASVARPMHSQCSPLSAGGPPAQGRTGAGSEKTGRVTARRRRLLAQHGARWCGTPPCLLDRLAGRETTPPWLQPGSLSRGFGLLLRRARRCPAGTATGSLRESLRRLSTLMTWTAHVRRAAHAVHCLQMSIATASRSGVADQCG
jgi:hypothetical protein